MQSPSDPYVPDTSSGARERLEHALISGRLSRRAFVARLAATGLGAATLTVLDDQLDAMRANQAERARSLQSEYDYVVVGTGNAACAMVGRLATQVDATILMVEAGDWDVAPAV